MSCSNAIANLHSNIQKIIDILIIVGMFYAAHLLHEVTFSTNEFYLTIFTLVSYSLLANFKSLYDTGTLAYFFIGTKNLILVWLSVCFLITLALFASKQAESFSRLIIISWMIIVPIMLIVSRRLMTLLRMNSQANKVNIAVVGNNPTSDYFLKHIQTLQWPWLRLYGVYDFAPNPLAVKTQTHPINDLITAVKAGHINAVYIALPLLGESKIDQLLIDLADTTVSAYIIPDLFVSNIMKSNWTNFAGLSVISVYAAPFQGLSGLIKRILDIVLSMLILVIIWPLMLVIALAIKLTSKGPALFKQRRYGLDGKVISVWKFRTMSVCEDGPQLAQAQKNDVRITPLGKYLRKTSLDELPQFFNVLQGRLSVVGPRPHANAHNEEYRKLITGYMLRHKVKPGITGLAQVNGWRGETDSLFKMEKRVEYDLEYIQNWSVGLDLKIVLLTIIHGFYDKNAY